MSSITYIGEHLLIGQIGHFFIILAFVSTLLSAYSYAKSINSNHEQWKFLGRLSFTIHGISVCTSIGLILFMMVSKYYEYAYVQAHVNDELPVEYILSAFWEGQEGSFLLWMMWNAVLTLTVIHRRDKWEAGIGLILAIFQGILLMMILGIQMNLGYLSFKVGSSPFLLLRDSIDAPIFANQNYLELIEGQGLNELLQNYWNVIHPPITFLGFSSLTFPFAYGLTSLMTKDYTSWLQPAKKWALWGGGILGLGIIMGAAWAYEALTFGGYWAWDPVENMVLVPWLMLIGGLHTNLIALATRQSIRSTYIFYFLAFLLILYSTFLTRSGVLGETSVHAFTEMGLETQMLGLIGVFTFWGLGYLAYRLKEIPIPDKEEKTQSREFIMFIGALTIVISSCLITYGTSLPIFNKILKVFDPSFQEMVINDPIEHYNKHQLWIGVLLGILSGIGQFFRYRENNWNAMRVSVLKEIVLSAGIATILSFLCTFLINIHAWQYYILLFAGIYAIVANILYLINYTSQRMKIASSILSHTGFGVLILGALASGLNKEIISNNFLSHKGLANIDSEVIQKNVVLIKDIPNFMSGYRVTYNADTILHHNRTYEILFEKMDSSYTKVVDAFTSYPNLIYNEEYSNVSAVNPSIKRGIGKDIFTHISYLPSTTRNLQQARTFDDSLKYDSYTGHVGDTIYTKHTGIYISEIQKTTLHPKYEPKEGDYVISAEMHVIDITDDTTYRVYPTLILRDQFIFSLPIEIKELQMRIRMQDSTLQQMLEINSQSLRIDTLIIKQKETITSSNFSFTLEGISKEVDNPTYIPKEEDIAFTALLRARNMQSEEEFLLKPIYYLRNTQVGGIPDIHMESGLQITLDHVNPSTGEFSFSYSQANRNEIERIFFEVSEEVPLTDYIVLQAIVFPGINLVWLGSLMMITGLMLGLWNKRINRKYAD